MSDGDFLRAVQDREIPTKQFHHGDHLRLAWLLLERLPFDDALQSLRKALRSFAVRTGKPENFHETLTQGWLRLLAAQQAATLDEALREYPQDGSDPMHSFWQPETLRSPQARAEWVPPDVAELPPISARWTQRTSTVRAKRTSKLHIDALPHTGPVQMSLLVTEAQYAHDQPVTALPHAAQPGIDHDEPATLKQETHEPMSSGFTWTSAFGKGSGWLLQKIVNGLALSKISPNTLTFVGLIINIIAALFFGYARGQNAHRMFLYAGLILIGAGLFDMVDGRVARQTNQVSVFGAFFDSVIDRYSDVAIFFGLLVYYARGNRFVYVVLVAFVMTASLMVSYTRARAEALIGSCKVGFMERPERIVLVILGALADTWGVMAPALWTLAALSTLTVIHRIRYTYLETERRKLVPSAR